MKCPPRSYLVDILLPKFALHLLSGSSGARKTTLGFQFVQRWEQGKPILGFESHPEPWAYLAIDRTVADVWEVLNIISYSPPEERIASLNDLEWSLTFGSVIRYIKEKLPKGGMLFAEGLQFLTPKQDNNQYVDVGKHLNFMRREAAKLGVTICATVHNAKAKPGEEYAHPRDAIMGSVAWGATTGSLFSLRRTGGEHSTDRELMVCPRGAPEFKRKLESINGRLELVDEDESQEGNMMLDSYLTLVVPGEIFTTAKVREWAESAKISQRTMERWLTYRLKMGRIFRVAKGEYRLIAIQ